MIRYDRARRRFAVTLAALAGFVDAVGFLSANGYFVSFMSGNTTRLGVALGTAPSRALAPALLIGAFLCGVTGGALVALGAGRWRKPAITAMVALVLLCGASARAFGTEIVMLGLLAFAMGAINNTFQRGGEVAIGLTYMTGALVKLGQGMALRLAGRDSPGWTGWARLWAGLLSGAIAGAFLQDRLPFGCLWIAGGWATIMALFALRLPAEA
ncbi:hypothetical protein Y88_2103 [Novosphingobium nitrogenifigens DSM 19370]|uniref:DUF1275 domain-containing protein n=1 Tax=Novosphingobium nitrogenifigens DSM 19370 TaxID=983920 RepID=F1Z5W9_9SPHN|nr:YoaK family protein [Novosphingobium nitrogenifigens]EGD60229.1 hypothetical protein Y88_2103 [Novosphingobium nitrogenifigens DSM 19370]